MTPLPSATEPAMIAALVFRPIMVKLEEFGLFHTFERKVILKRDVSRKEKRPMIRNDPRQWVDAQFCDLTTTGRVTGTPHTIEIWFALDPEDATRLAMMAGGGRKSDWVRNLEKTPSVTITLGTLHYLATARIVTADEPDDALIRRLLVEKYRSPSQPLDTWGRTALPVLFTLHPNEAKPVE